jgi:pimeloyl-ACP methyl ester carboxylesterase
VVSVALGAVAAALAGAAAVAAEILEDVGIVGTLSADLVRLYIEDSGGAGRAVVLIHGWPLSAQAWEPQVSALRAAGYRVVVYGRRGFGRSDKPESAYGYNVLADDLQRVLDYCELQDATLVGFSMGGGEVARCISRHGEARLHSVVLASAVPPYLLHSADNPEGPLRPEASQKTKNELEQNRDSFFDHFTKEFFSANGVLQVTESQRGAATALCLQSAQNAALACMDAFSSTDFREDLKKVNVPTLVIHGNADAIVPIEGSGLRTHRAIVHSQLVRVCGAPHGLNVSHVREFNDALLSFLKI